MGHNYARDNRKRRLKRAKKEDKKLDAWAKMVCKQLRTLYDKLYLIEADCQLENGGTEKRQLYVCHIEVGQKVVAKWDLPEPMTYFKAVKYIEDLRNDVEVPTKLPDM